MQSVSAAPSPPATLRKKTEFQVGPWQVGECAKLGCKKLAALSALACDRQSQTETDEERWPREREEREREGGGSLGKCCELIKSKNDMH